MAIQNELPEESFRIEGVYAGLLRRECERLTEADPRLLFSDPDRLARLQGGGGRGR